MNSRITKVAVAAVIVIAVLIRTNVFCSWTDETVVAELVRGPKTHTFDDGSTVVLSEGAEIRLYGSKRRGFEHLAGGIEVSVSEGAGEFVVATSFGTVKALGTVFGIDLVNTDSIDVMAVKVKEGSVEIGNRHGSRVIGANQGVTVERDQAPYDFRQDKNLPARLIKRIEGMLRAMETGDKRAWIANFNIRALYDLAKGKIEYADHRDWFSGMSGEDAQRFREAFADVSSPEEMAERLLAGINIDKPQRLYVRSVTLASDGKHAVANCVKRESHKRHTGYTPQWAYFDGDWWQTDD